jgi:hypothetical protein
LLRIMGQLIEVVATGVEQPGQHDEPRRTLAPAHGIQYRR